VNIYDVEIYQSYISASHFFTHMITKSYDKRRFYVLVYERNDNLYKQAAWLYETKGDKCLSSGFANIALDKKLAKGLHSLGLGINATGTN